MKKRVVIIDPATRTISEGEVSSLKDMQALVGGNIELVQMGLPGSHELYVNEEGRFDSSLKPWTIEYEGQIFEDLVGPGFIIGDARAGGWNRSARISIYEVQRLVVWHGK